MFAGAVLGIYLGFGVALAQARSANVESPDVSSEVNREATEGGAPAENGTPADATQENQADTTASENGGDGSSSDGDAPQPVEDQATTQRDVGEIVEHEGRPQPLTSAAPALQVRTPEYVRVPGVRRSGKRRTFGTLALGLSAGASRRVRWVESSEELAPPQGSPSEPDSEEKRTGVAHNAPLVGLGADLGVFGVGPLVLHLEAGLVVVTNDEDALRVRGTGRVQALLGPRKECAVTGRAIDQHRIAVLGYQQCINGGVTLGGGTMGGVATMVGSQLKTAYVDMGFGRASERSYVSLTLAKVAASSGWGILFSRRGLPTKGNPWGILADAGFFWSLPDDSPLQGTETSVTRVGAWLMFGVSWGSGIFGPRTEWK